MSADGPLFSQLVQGYWRLLDWNIDASACLDYIKQHIELGITTVDQAAVYGNGACEQLFGDALRLEPALRGQLEIVSKCGIQLAGNKSAKITHYNSSSKAILASVDASLARLGTDYLDALLLHRPDYLLNADEVASAFSQLQQQGKVLNFGVSNFSCAQFALVQASIDTPLITNQVEINPLNLGLLDSGMLEILQQQHIRPMAWSCLAGGKIASETSEQAQRLRSTLHELAGELGAQSIEQVVVAWVMRLPSQPVAIMGTGKIERLRVMAQSLALCLTHEQWYRVWCAAKGAGVP
ncbi:MAG: oxidoreductase [Pseudomonadales bacterium]|nr:aldo/keto reductase [Gammaproteobacteria bacterium]NNL57083.1 oxidoreductase [Pseudomonadales bacterium]